MNEPPTYVEVCVNHEYVSPCELDKIESKLCDYRTYALVVTESDGTAGRRITRPLGTEPFPPPPRERDEILSKTDEIADSDDTRSYSQKVYDLWRAYAAGALPTTGLREALMNLPFDPPGNPIAGAARLADEMTRDPLTKSDLTEQIRTVGEIRDLRETMGVYFDELKALQDRVDDWMTSSMPDHGHLAIERRLDGLEQTIRHLNDQVRAHNQQLTRIPTIYQFEDLARRLTLLEKLTNRIDRDVWDHAENHQGPERT